jgi:hypothetical protein
MYCIFVPVPHTSFPSLSCLSYVSSRSTPLAFTTQIHRAALFVYVANSRSPGSGPFTYSAAHILLVSCALPSRRNFSDLNTYDDPTRWLHSPTRRSDINATASRATCFLNNCAPCNPVAGCLAFIPNLLRCARSTPQKPDNMQAITMVGTIHRPRVQSPKSEMKKKKDITQVTAQDQTKPATAVQKRYHDARTTSTNASMPLRGMSVFSKKHVASTNEIAHNDHFQSELRATVASAGSPSTACESGFEDSSSDSPFSSLVLTAPVYREVNGRLEEQSPAASANEQSRAHSPKDEPSFNWLTEALVNLFAGRRRSKSMSSTDKRHASSTSTTVPNTATTDQAEPSAHLYAQNTCARTPPPAVSPPILTHRQVIPTVTRPQRKDPSRAPVYKNEPCAPENKYTGYGVTAEDIFTPVTIQRGFNAPSSTPAPDDLLNRRNQSTSNLLDREGDVWARWHTKYPTPESHPFIRSPSVTV